MWCSRLEFESFKSFCVAGSLWPTLCTMSDRVCRNLNANIQIFLCSSWLNSTVFSRAEETFFSSQNTGIDKILIQCLSSLLNWNVYQFIAVREVYSLASWSCSAFLGTLRNPGYSSMSIREVSVQIYTSAQFYPSNLETHLCHYAFHLNKKTHK